MTKHIPVPEELLRKLLRLAGNTPDYEEYRGPADDLRALLDGPGVEPVAFIDETGALRRYKPSDFNQCEFGGLDRLYLAAPSASAQAVPDGWQLVPKHATHEMCEAVHFGSNCAEEKMQPSDREFWEACYADMLAAAPQAPSAKPASLGNYETYNAIRQAHEIAASDEYFKARPQLECADRRKVFESGFVRGFDARDSIATSPSAKPIAIVSALLEDHVSNGDGTYSLGAFLTVQRPLADGERLYAHPNSDAKDAARYRWLRSKAVYEGSSDWTIEVWGRFASIEEAIDAAMEQEERDERSARGS